MIPKVFEKKAKYKTPNMSYTRLKEQPVFFPNISSRQPKPYQTQDNSRFFQENHFKTTEHFFTQHGKNNTPTDLVLLKPNQETNTSL